MLCVKYIILVRTLIDVCPSRKLQLASVFALPVSHISPRHSSHPRRLRASSRISDLQPRLTTTPRTDLPPTHTYLRPPFFLPTTQNIPTRPFPARVN